MSDSAIWIARVASAAIAVGLVVAAVPAAASQEFDVTAAVDGMRIATVPAKYLPAEPVDMGVPTAQATVRSASGESQAFASHPYPGNVVLGVPGTARNGSGQSVPPDYPLYAASQYPAVPEDKVEQPGYSLTARSSQAASTAVGNSGTGTDSGAVGRVIAKASATVEPTAGAVAESVTEGISVNDVLTLGRVQSSAAVSVQPDGKVRLSSYLAFADTTVAGQRVAITPQGVVAADQTAATPSSTQLSDVLAAAGVRVRYLVEQRTTHGVVSAGVEVLAEQDDPAGGAAPFVVRLVLGRAAAYAQPTNGAAELPLPPSSSPGGFAPPLSEVVGQAPIGAVSAPMAPASVPSGNDLPELVETAPLSSAADPAPRLVPSLSAGAVGFYLVIVFAAAAAFVGGSLIRLLGVRSRWSS